MQSDEFLMQQVQNGNTGAAEQLYDRYFVRLCAFAFKGFQVEFPEDLVQDVFIKILENPGQFDPALRFQTWIFSLVANRCKNQIRNQNTREKHHEFLQNEKRVVYQQHQLEASEIKVKINQLFHTLNEKEKQIFCLKYEHHCSHAEIAEILQIPEGSVKSGLFYILKKLTHKLQVHLS